MASVQELQAQSLQNGVHVGKPGMTSAPVPSRRQLPDVCYRLRRKVAELLQSQTDDKMARGVQRQVENSLGVIEEALRRYKPEHLCLSYNGGKDCLVLLILILASLPAWAETVSEPSTDTTTSANAPPQSSPSPQPLQAIYIVPPDPFPEVEDFVAATAEEYHLDLARYALPMRPALEAYLAEKKAVEAIFMGTRRTDPHGEFLTHFDPTDKDWPRFMRVHPVIDWHYAEIWAFLRQLEIPFCSLYSKGFTSLGGINDTRPNPALALDEAGTAFRPAYELMADDEERLGRAR